MSSSFGDMPGYLSEPTMPERAEEVEGGTGGLGWVVFGGIMIIIVGFLNMLYGIAAIDGARFYADDARFIFGDLNTWGWVHLALGAIQFCSGFLILFGSNFGRWIGIFSASANAITQMVFIDAYPLLALSIIGIDILVIYGLAAHAGSRIVET
jgi:hypothetical protein